MGTVWFVFLGIVGTVALTAVSFARWSWWLRGVIALAVTTGVAVAFMTVSAPTTLGSSRLIDQTPYRELILFALMLVGMAARVLSLAIERRKVTATGPFGPVAVDRWEFVYPMLFAVPTFGALLSQIPDTLDL